MRVYADILIVLIDNRAFLPVYLDMFTQTSSSNRCVSLNIETSTVNSGKFESFFQELKT